TNVATPSLPNSGTGMLYADSTSLTLNYKNASGGTTHTIQTASCTGGNFISAVSDSGVVTCKHAPTSNQNIRGLEFEIGSPAGTTLTTAYNTVVYKTVPFSCTLAAYNLTIDSGTITVKFSRLAAGGIATPTLSNSINTSGVSIATFSTATHSTTM